MKALVGTFNQEKALVGTFSVIVKTDGSFAALVHKHDAPVVPILRDQQPASCMLCKYSSLAWAVPAIIAAPRLARSSSC